MIRMVSKEDPHAIVLVVKDYCHTFEMANDEIVNLDIVEMMDNHELVD